ncbi:MAG: hypothetical protein IPN69_18735 [Acidobacteria bacterium]|nr:hypothetical protein [Acidobacteriota bacterium]
MDCTRNHWILIAVLAVSASLAACSQRVSDVRMKTEQHELTSVEICRYVSGRWIVYNPPSSVEDKDCQRKRCGPIVGLLELTCSGDTVSGKMLLGISSQEAQPNESWADVSAELKRGSVALQFSDDECIMRLLLNDFEMNQLSGEISSENCRVLGREIRWDGKVVLVRTR